MFTTLLNLAHWKKTNILIGIGGVYVITWKCWTLRMKNPWNLLTSQERLVSSLYVLWPLFEEWRWQQQTDVKLRQDDYLHGALWLATNSQVNQIEIRTRIENIECAFHCGQVVNCNSNKKKCVLQNVWRLLECTAECTANCEACTQKLQRIWRNKWLNCMRSFNQSVSHKMIFSHFGCKIRCKI